MLAGIVVALDQTGGLADTVFGASAVSRSGAVENPPRGCTLLLSPSREAALARGFRLRMRGPVSRSAGAGRTTDRSAPCGIVNP